MVKKKNLLRNTGVIILIGSLIAGLLTGCGKNENATSDISTDGEFSYPIKTDKTLDFWYVDYSAGAVVREEAPLYQAIDEAIGVKTNYIPVSPSVAKEQFNLLLASGNIPDLVQYDWANVTGGAQSIVDSGLILGLNDLIDSDMPNMKKYLVEDEIRVKQAKNDDGNYCFVPSFRGDAELLTYTGPIVRKDWLDELGLSVPETIDEWHTVLTAFKEKKGASSPFICDPVYLTMFMGGAYPVSTGGYSEDCYLVDGKVVYGPIQDSFKQAVKVLSSWYKEGLIDQNIASIDTSNIDSKMTNGQAGASIALAGGGIGKWMKNTRETDPSYDLVGTKYPVVNKGDTPYLGQYDNTMLNASVAISAKVKDKKLAARYLDYFFSEEGKMLFNYGKEGVSYDMVDGKPVFKEEILKGSDFSKYANPNGGLGIQVWDAYNQSLLFDNQREAIKNWGISNTKDHLLPLLSPTSEEISLTSSKFQDIKTYQSEMFFKFLFGVEDIETGFDAYVRKIKDMGIDEVIKCKQKAYDRFKAR